MDVLYKQYGDKSLRLNGDTFEETEIESEICAYFSYDPHAIVPAYVVDIFIKDIEITVTIKYFKYIEGEPNWRNIYITMLRTGDDLYLELANSRSLLFLREIEEYLAGINDPQILDRNIKTIIRAVTHKFDIFLNTSLDI